MYACINFRDKVRMIQKGSIKENLDNSLEALKNFGKVFRNLKKMEEMKRINKLSRIKMQEYQMFSHLSL